MKLDITNQPPVVGAPMRIDTGCDDTGIFITADNAGKGEHVKLGRLSVDEARNLGLGLISSAAVFDFAMRQQAAKAAATDVNVIEPGPRPVHPLLAKGRPRT